ADDADVRLRQERVQALLRGSCLPVEDECTAPDLVSGVGLVERVAARRLDARHLSPALAQEFADQCSGHAEPEVDDPKVAKTVSRLLHAYASRAAREIEASIPVC